MRRLTLGVILGLVGAAIVAAAQGYPSGYSGSITLPLAVASGGTGSTTAAAARTALVAAPYGPWATVSVGGTPLTEGANLFGGFKAPTAGKIRYASCMYGAAGTNGGGQTVKVAVVVDGGAELCSCDLGACDTAANTLVSCDCGGAGGTTYVADASYAFQIKNTTDCTVNPADIFCNIGIGP